MTFTTYSGTLNPAAPFDFAQTLKFLGMFMPARGEQPSDDRLCIKALPVDGRVVVAKMTSSGTIEQPCIDYTFYADAPLSKTQQRAALDRLRFYLSLDDDLHAFYAIGQDDPQFAPVLQRLYGLHQVKFVTPFENAAWAILSQRTYMNVARKVKDALTERYGGNLTVDGVVYRAFPEAAAFLAAGDDALNLIVRNTHKTDCLMSAARAFADVDEQWLRDADYDTVEKWLRKIKGIGVWSASFVLLRGLGCMERIPRDDARLKEAVHKFYGGGDAQSLAAFYGEHQGYWAYYLRVAA